MKIIIRTIKFIKELLPKKYKIKALAISILLFINSGLELIGLSAILPLFVVLLENSVVEKYQWAAWLYAQFNLTDERQLIVILAIVFRKNWKQLSRSLFLFKKSETAFFLFGFDKCLH